MLINRVPFYPNNDEFHCINAALQSLLRFYQRKDYTTAFIDSLLRRDERVWPWMPECALLMHDLGLKFKYFSKTNLMDYLKGDKFLREIVGASNNSYIKHTDFKHLENSVYKLESLGLFEQRELSLDEVSRFIKKGYLPLFVIHNIFTNPVPALGKYVVVTKIDKDFVYYHETGPKHKMPDRAVLREDFINAWFKSREVILTLGNYNIHQIK